VTINKKKIGIVLVVVILLFSLLTLLYWSFVRDTFIVPIYYVIWVGDLALKSVPQQAYLAFLILISLFIGVNTLLSMRVRRFTRGVERIPTQNESRYNYWRKLCSNLYSSPFAQDTFAWEARKLILSIFAYQNGIESAQIEAMIRNDVLSVPEPIRKLIEEKKIQDFNPAPKPTENIVIRLQRWLFPVEASQKLPIDDAVTEIVAYIEYLLEVDHARK
jgi:ABC-type multidrug transport system fused ATPase/permease subunit